MTGHGRSIEQERDFYRRLLDLGGQEEIETLLAEALALVVDVTGATLAYLEIYDEHAAEPRYWRGHGCSERDLERIRASISHGIIARTLSHGETVETPSAREDPRFEDLASVKRNEIDAVLCAPVGTRPPIGVVYLQGQSEAGSFSPADRTCAELFARHLAPIADRLVNGRHEPGEAFDFTQEIRKRVRCEGLVGRSRALGEVLRKVAMVAQLELDLLITGPSGTGKSALAHIIAINSLRATGPFVELNCAAIPETLLESELFGAEKGAHSTATRRMVGKVAAAEGGTLFLDEITQLSPAAQAKLLMLLQTKRYHPLGATTPSTANVRIISATNANLEALILTREFRDDLYYRLNTMPIELPGLAHRREDIPDLVEHFCADACRRHKFPRLTVSRRATFACREAAWPGHVRQLSSAIEAATIRAHDDRSRTVREHDIFPHTPLTEGGDVVSFQEATEVCQRRHILEVLEATDWNIAEAARRLDLARSHVYNLMQRFGIVTRPRTPTPRP